MARNNGPRLWRHVANGAHGRLAANVGGVACDPGVRGGGSAGTGGSKAVGETNGS